MIVSQSSSAHVFGRLDDVDACVVHEDVDPPEGLHGRLDEPAAALAVTRVDARWLRRTSGGLDRCNRLLHLVGMPSADDHRGAGIGEPRGNRFPPRPLPDPVTIATRS